MRLASTAMLAAFCACAAFGQTAEPAPRFDVASVKASATPTGEGRNRETLTPTPGGVTMLNVHLKTAIQWAYHLQAIQVSGPGWLDDNRFDIVAKTANEASTERERAMMQTLLAERFGLAAHRETKEMPAYVLTVGKNGHKLTPSVGDGEMTLTPTPKHPMAAQFSHVTVAQLTDRLTSMLQGVVVDQTGIQGAFDFTLDMAPIIATVGGGSEFKPTGIDDMINLIIQAAREQLGIVIEQKKVPATVLVVDHAEKTPIEN